MKNKNIFWTTMLLILIVPQYAWAKPAPPPPPQNYTFENLREGMREQSFFFADKNKPVYAKVNLGYFSFYPASYSKFIGVRNRLISSSGKYRVNLYERFPWWNDSIERTFDWNRFRQDGGARGDLIFTRGNGKTADFVKLFSQWTHIAISNRPEQMQVFESTPDTNVDLNYTPAWWSRLTYFTCKKIRNQSYQRIWNSLDNGINKFRYKPYYPTNVSTSIDRLTFLYRWSDKNDMESMYCSKLVYNIFKDYVNLDSDNTSTYTDNLQNKPWLAPIFSWIGVSPDDIYYSEQLDWDFNYSPNVNVLI